MLIKTITRNYSLNSMLWIYPLLEVTSFILCLYYFSLSIYLSIFFLILSSFLLSLSVHICFHEYVHQGKSKLSILSSFITILMGMPFDGYKLHHLNHHKFDNNKGDFSSTWIFTGESKMPKSFFEYIFLWPRQVLEAGKFARKESHFQKYRRAITVQKIILVGWLALLFSIAIKFFIFYIILIYFGWVFVSIHNYGQHLPIDKLTNTYSYLNKAYNFIFFRNGLHVEHHQHPNVPWYEIEPVENSSKVNVPHFLVSLKRKL